MTGTTFRAFVDRFEGDRAILLLGEDENLVAVVPRSILPEEAREGAVLNVTIRCDAEQTHRAEAEISSLIDELTADNG